MRHAMKIVALLLGLGALGDAHAATFTLDRDVVPAGGTIVFHITTELAGWPGVWPGAEFKSGLILSGPCSNGWSGAAPPGSSVDVPFPGPLWGPNPNYPHGCPTLSRPGDYVMTLHYRRYDDSPAGSTEYQIALPFTVLKLELRALPYDIRAGETVLIEASGMAPDERATSLQVECPDGSVDSALDVTPIDDGFSVIWPGPYFAGACDSSQAGGYRVTLTTDSQTATAGFRAVADRDGDGWSDLDDNCPNDANAGQEDVDGDRRGDVCDDDRDNDARRDEDDNCPDVANTPQDDLDVDGLGDACDPDIEDDGDLNVADNCDYHWNPGQENVDGDAFGDACDPDPDDSDNDGVNDLVDNCWNLFNPAQQDDDGDGIGSACDPDIDGDGMSNGDEAVAGTHPNDPQPLEAGINEFFDGAAIASGGSAVDGEPVGVVVNPATDASSVDVTVTDPWGNPYAQETLIPQSPVVFWFVPIWPGEWRIDAEIDNGESYSATLLVIPEPGAALGGAAGMGVVLGFAAQRRRRSSSSSSVFGQSSCRSRESARSASSLPSV